MNTYKICVRYVNENLKVIERFLGFVGTSSTTAETLANHLVKFMDELALDYSNYLVGQCYDGAANMSGWRNGLNVKIRALAFMALYVHCYAHQFNLCLVDACNKIKGF